MNEEQVDRIKDRISSFLTTHRTETEEIASKISNIFEAFCFVLFVLHYEREGLKPKVENLTPDNIFKFRFSTAGYPWNFSYFSVRRHEENDEVLFEVRHNQQVVGHYVEVDTGSDEKPGLFALDIAVIKPDGLPNPPMGTKYTNERTYVLNDDLITFGESKKLVAYPMLLASFYGVVHELRPEFLEGSLLPSSFDLYPHPFPVLFTADFLTKGTKNVLKTFEDRQLKVTVVEDVNGSPEDQLLRRMKGIREDEPLATALEVTITEITNPV